MTKSCDSLYFSITDCRLKFWTLQYIDVQYSSEGKLKVMSSEMDPTEIVLVR
jgi:hypothetical protein